jgi:hypothetical protein
VHIYNPYVREPNGILKGHLKSIINVKFVRSDTRIMSFSHDRVLRVWSVKFQMLIYKVESCFPKGPERILKKYLFKYSLKISLKFKKK